MYRGLRRRRGRSAGVMTSRRALGEGPLGLRLIVGYKLIKSLAQGLLAAALFSAVGGELVDRLAAWGRFMLEHGTQAWSIALAKLVGAIAVAGDKYRALIELALGADALVSGLEAWALSRRYAWGPWLVVVTTGSLVPFELVALLRGFSVGRLVLMVVNTLIVMYLIASRRESVRSAPVD